MTKSSKCTLYVFISNILQNSVDINNIIDELNNKLKLNIKQTKRKDLLQFGGINKEEFNKCLEIIKDNIT